MSTPGTQRLSFARLVAFALPGLAIGALAVAQQVYLPQHYAGHFGLGLAGVGAAFMAIRLIDTGFDPLIGLMMDRTHTRFGRYRAWLAGGTPVLMLAVTMLFIPPGSVSLTYLVGWLLLYYVGASLVVLPHLSWASVIAGEYHERSRVFGVIQVVSVISATAVLIFPVALKAALHDPHLEIVALMGGYILIVTALGVATALVATPEHVVADQHAQALSARDYWAMISRPDMGRIILADFCLAMGPGWMAATYLFYFRDARGFDTTQASLLLLVYIASGIIGAGALSRIAQRIGKHHTQMIAAVGYSLGLLGVAALPRGAFGPAAAAMFAMGFLASGFILLDRAMVADASDAVRLQTGKHRVGLLYAMLTTVQKIAQGLSIGFSFKVLALIGYDPREGAHNTTSAIAGMQLVFLVGPVAFVMLGAACYLGYGLDARRHAEIRAALAARERTAALEP